MEAGAEIRLPTCRDAAGESSDGFPVLDRIYEIEFWSVLKSK